MGAACERIFFSNQKNIPSRFPRKIVRGDFDFPPDNPLKTTKGGQWPPFGNPGGGWTKSGVTGDVGTRGEGGVGISAGGVNKGGRVATIAPAALSEAGTFASAASGGRSEQKGVAAVKIL